jgi:hypothetical protein
MNVTGVSRRIVRKVAAQFDLLERARREIVAAAAGLLQPRGVLLPVRVVAAPQRSSNDAASAGRVGKRR